MISTTATDLPRVMQCTGSVDMPASLPPSIMDEARLEGNAAHLLAQAMFHGQPVHVGMRVSNGYIVTDEMLEYTSEYVSALDCGQMEVNTSWDEVRGRCDHLKYEPSRVVGYINGGNGNVLEDCEAILTIDEFKTGYRLVEVFENWTLLSHAIGWCIQNQIAPDLIVLRVHQPRAFHQDGPLRVWSIDYPTLMGYHARILARLSTDTPILQTGPKCMGCPAESTCPAARNRDMRAIDATSVVFTDDLPDGALTAQYELLDYALKSMESRRDALAELMMHRITQGRPMPNYTLKPRYGHTKWNTGMSGAMLTAMSGVDCTKDAICTPAEAKRRGVSEEVVKALTHRPSIGSKLTKIDAEREVRNAFGGDA